MAGSECEKDFLHFGSCVLDARLLDPVGRALVLTRTATLHAGGDMGASSSRLSLEHNVKLCDSSRDAVLLMSCIGDKCEYSIPTEYRPMWHPIQPAKGMLEPAKSESPNPTTIGHDSPSCDTTRTASHSPFCTLTSAPQTPLDLPVEPYYPSTHVARAQSASPTRSGLGGRPPVMQPKIERHTCGGKSCRAAAVQ